MNFCSDDLDVDLDDEAGSGINEDADLDWLPDPDLVKNEGFYLFIKWLFSVDSSEEQVPKKKRRRVSETQKTEETAIALLETF